MNITPRDIFFCYFQPNYNAKVQPSYLFARYVSSEYMPWTDPLMAPLVVLWLYLPGYLSNTAAMLGGKWIPEITGMRVFPIDAGRVMSDGNRILGDGKTWNGLIGGTLGGGLLAILTTILSDNNEIDAAPFLSPVGAYWVDPVHLSQAWFYFDNEIITAFIIGSVMGFGCMIGDSIGSFIKRRLGHKREGEESSEAPLLDTLPFAISTFIFGLLFLNKSIAGSSELLTGMIILLFITPILHRSFNIIGYKLGLKSVPY